MNNLKEILEDENIDCSSQILSILKEEQAIIKLPKNLIRDINKDLITTDLTNIHKDREAALELIYLLLSNFTFTWLREVKFNDNYVDNKYIQLNGRILKKQIGTGIEDTTRYRLILNLLIEHNYIEKGLGHKMNVKSTSYKIHDKYYKSSFDRYGLNSQYAQQLHKRNIRKKLDESLRCIIAKNEISNLDKIELPNTQEVKAHLQSYSRKKWKNKKGKQLKTLGKKKRVAEYVYVEDYIKLFELLRDNFNIPKIGGENAGYRVTTKYNLMPLLIRELFKVKSTGNKLVSLDFSCFHPNLIFRKFGGANNQVITHELVAEFLKKKKKKYEDFEFEELVKIAKVEHLSFFNKNEKYMEESPVYDFYKENHQEILDKVIKDKLQNTYKNTSRVLFKLETKIMTEIIERCSSSGILAIYVFDELMVEDVNFEKVKGIMKDVCLKLKLNVRIK
ncbi:hypothetical protein [Psychroflexus montanilacus]|uniref:hypothetical protein n=1 Tax=Psychroflexus montanilacus TaxID=2873598 RepID=UPI001CCB611D|nr:hypothetical protein [Psychroflexus montanilacus]MBZ9652649.1 hypothetical protein [Psychroflexus montanilacus]